MWVDGGMERSGNLIDSVMKTSAAATAASRDNDGFFRAKINDGDVFKAAPMSFLSAAIASIGERLPKSVNCCRY